MRLRKPCEHDRYDEHVIWNGGAGKPVCPGGEFLPEDALVIERGSWPLWLTEIISEWGLDPQMFLSDVEDAYVETLETDLSLSNLSHVSPGQRLSEQSSGLDRSRTEANPDQVGEPG